MFCNVQPSGQDHLCRIGDHDGRDGRRFGTNDLGPWPGSGTDADKRQVPLWTLTEPLPAAMMGRVRIRRRSRALAITLTLLVVALALPLYYRVGWSRMESHCADESPGKAAFEEVHYSFTFRGFTCTYDGARTEAAYWFAGQQHP